MAGCCGHGLHFGHRVDRRGRTNIYRIVEQKQGIARCCHTGDSCHTNGGVLRAGQCGCGVGSGVAVGTGKHCVVSIHQRLHLGYAVHRGANDGRAVQCAVNGRLVGRAHAGDARCRIHRGLYHRGQVVGVGRCLDLVQGSCRCSGHRGDDILQLLHGVHSRIGCFGTDGILNSHQVARIHAGDTQIDQIGCTECGDLDWRAACRIDNTGG